MAGRVLEVGVVTGDGVERFQNVACEETFGIFGRLIRHESVNEGPSSGRSYNTTKWCIEEVRIVADGLLEAGSAVFGEYLKINAVAVLLTEFIQCGKLRDLNQVIIATVGGSASQDPRGTHARILLFI